MVVDQYILLIILTAQKCAVKRTGTITGIVLFHPLLWRDRPTTAYKKTTGLVQNIFNFKQILFL